jgi:hypothetical protein
MTAQMQTFLAALKKGQTVSSAILGSVNLGQTAQATTTATRSYSRLNGAPQLWP